jgi:hypothetical protein
MKTESNISKQSGLIVVPWNFNIINLEDVGLISFFNVTCNIE